MVRETIPLVSVVIPMYNAAKFISQTLESLIYQTMQDFEIVVVDDCSIDNSVEVVESFTDKFVAGGGGYQRLHIIKLPENTETPGLPRNVGIQFARGKYIAFLDSDDLFTKTALEELTTLAEEYQADVVHSNDSYRVFGGKKMSADDPRMTDFAALTAPKNHGFSKWRHPLLPRPKTLPAPTLNPDTLEERVKAWVAWSLRTALCTVFCRRDFLINNQILFSNIIVDEDFVFIFKCLCLAKNFLRAPNVYYIIRPRAGSLTRTVKNFQYDEEYFRNYFKGTKNAFRELNKFMDTISFFAENEYWRFAVQNFFLLRVVNFRIGGKISAGYTHLFYRLIKEEFSTDSAELAALLLNTSNFFWIKIRDLRKSNEKLKTSNAALMAEKK